MIQPDKDILMAIFRLRNDPNFRQIIKWFRDSLMEQSINNNHSIDERVFRITQGENQNLEKILKEIDGIEENIKQRLEPPKSVVT